MAEKHLYKPSSRGMRDPTSNQQQNGQVVNPPRMAEMGGFNSTRKGYKTNDKKIRRPGGTS